MSTPAPIPRPGVEVIQVFQAVTPSVVTPTLVPCIIGVAKQVVEVLEQDDSGSSILNTDAQITLPAFFQAPDAVGGPPVVYTGLDGLSLVISINNGPNVTILFADALVSGLTPATVVTQITAAFTTATVTAAVAEVVGNAFRIRTVGIGETQTIFIDPTTSAAILTAFAIGADKTYTGVDSYRNYQLDITQESFPDPRSNLSELAIEAASIRVFLATNNATNLREALRDEAFLRRTADDTAAVVTGTVDMVAAITFGIAGDLDGDDIDVSVDGGAYVNVSMGSGAGTVASSAALAVLFSAVPGLTATVDDAGATEFLVLTTDALGRGASISLRDGAGVPIADLGLGFTPETEPVDGGPEAQAQVIGTVDLTTLTLPGDVTGLTLSLQIDGGTATTTTFTAGATTVALLLAEINAQIDTDEAAPTLVATTTTDFLTLTTAQNGDDASITILAASTSLTILGLTAANTVGTSPIVAVDDGNGDNFTNLLQFIGEDFTAASTASVVTGTVDLTTLTYGGGGEFDPATTIVISDGQVPQTISLGTGLADETALVAAINAVVGPAAGGNITASLSGNFLALTHSDTGKESFIEISGTSLADLGLTAGITRGPIAMPAAVGDELWVDGVNFALITEVAPGATATRLKIDKQIAISDEVGDRFFIVAKGLAAVPVGDRPLPELIVDLNGDVIVKHELLRDSSGIPLVPTQARAPIFLSYTAIRQDVSPIAANAGLLQFDNLEELENTLEPLNTANPLGLGMFFALLNSPGSQVTGLGVSAVTAGQPFGTTAAFTQAAEFLESFEVYALAPLTHNRDVATVFNTHVTFMSGADQKGERIVLYNSAEPTSQEDTLVASSTNGNSSSETVFDTGIANLSALALAQGVSPVGTITVASGLFLDIASSAFNYSIISISGSEVTIRTTFAAGENDDGFYTTTDLNDPPLPSVLINETFTVKVRGATLTNVDGTPDKANIAATYASISATFANRRFWHTMPDSAGATIEGIEQIVPGFYMNAAIAGMIAQQPPQQSFTNFPMSGFTQVIGSSGFLSETQLNIVAGGGTYIIVQDTPGAPLISRMALTTDVTSVETRTDSITKVVDFTAKFIRRGIRNFIGRFNITQGFLDSLSSALQGLGGFLVETGVLIGFNLNNVIQDQDQPDTVLVDITLDVPFPANFIRVTLLV